MLYALNRCAYDYSKEHYMFMTAYLQFGCNVIRTVLALLKYWGLDIRLLIAHGIGLQVCALAYCRNGW